MFYFFNHCKPSVSEDSVVNGILVFVGNVKDPLSAFYDAWWLR